MFGWPSWGGGTETTVGRRICNPGALHSLRAVQQNAAAERNEESQLMMVLAFKKCRTQVRKPEDKSYLMFWLSAPGEST